jgi:hypothetical protein
LAQEGRALDGKTVEMGDKGHGRDQRVGWGSTASAMGNARAESLFRYSVAIQQYWYAARGMVSAS